MIIRTEQMSALKEVALQGFVTQMVAYAQTRHADYCTRATAGHGDGGRLRSRIESILAQGRAYGLAKRRNLRAFLDFLILNGEFCLDHSDYSIPRKALTNRSIAEDDKIQTLNDFQTFALSKPAQSPSPASQRRRQ